MNEGQYTTKVLFIVNGRRFECDAGLAFDKAVHNTASEAGLDGRYYVRLQRAGDNRAEFVTPQNAPRTVEAGMVVYLEPHAQAA